MLKAQTLIRQQRYSEARSILETVDHPKATDWLLRIESIAPAKRRSKAFRYTFATLSIISFLVAAFSGLLLFGDNEGLPDASLLAITFGVALLASYVFRKLNS